MVKLSPDTPSPNGRDAPPLEAGSPTALPAPLGSAALLPAQQRRATEFPEERPLRSLRAIYYALSRFLLGGMPLGRALSASILLLAGLWATGLLPGRWPMFALWLSLLVVHIATAFVLRRRDFVDFEPNVNGGASSASMAAEEKTPVYVTGLLTVEGKYRRFSFLPAYYRTFATREHAVLALARKRSLWGIAAVPDEEPGMWYAFLTPGQIRSITRGKVRFDGRAFDAVAVAYALTIPPKTRLHREKTTVETLYIAAFSENEVQRIWSDLVFDSQPEAQGAKDASTIVSGGD